MEKGSGGAGAPPDFKRVICVFFCYNADKGIFRDKEQFLSWNRNVLGLNCPECSESSFCRFIGACTAFCTEAG